MPCEEHKPNSVPRCLACNLADALDLTALAQKLKLGTTSMNEEPLSSKEMLSAKKNLSKRANAIAKNVAVLKSKLTEEEDDLRRSVFASLNQALRDLKQEMTVDELDPGDINPEHRTSYRDRLRQMGIWIGFAELTVLARLFGVRFSVDLGGGSRYQVGEGRSIARYVLRFRTNHYDVLDTLTSNVIETNKLGDCGLESFLVMLCQVFPLEYSPQGHNRGPLFLLLRSFSGLVDSANGDALPTDEDYEEAILRLRELLADEMTDEEVDHAIIAEGALPASGGKKSSKSKLLVFGKSQGGLTKLEWDSYATHVQTYFRLTKSLSCTTTEDDSFALVTNITDIDAASLLDRDKVGTLLKLNSKLKNRLYHEISVKVSESKSEKIKLTHLGYMLAEIELQSGKTSYLMCVIANFAAGRVTEQYPYMFTGKDLGAKSVSIPSCTSTQKKPEQEMFEALDMHTECFSFFILDQFIEKRLKSENVKAIRVHFVIQLNMCDRCKAATNLFQTKYKTCQLVEEHSAESGDSFDEDIIDEVDGLLKKDENDEKWDPY